MKKKRPYAIIEVDKGMAYIVEQYDCNITIIDLDGKRIGEDESTYSTVYYCEERELRK